MRRALARLTGRRRKGTRTACSTAARRPRRRPDREARAIELRIVAGEAPETFLCIECECWMIEPAYCLCRERAIW